MKLTLNMIYFILVCIPLATILFLAFEFVFFFLKFKKMKAEYQTPVMKIHSTVVPRSFLADFPAWDGGLYNNAKVIEA